MLRSHPPPSSFFLLIFIRWIGWEDYPLLLFDFSGRELCLLWKSFFLYWNFVICYKHFYCLHKYSIASVIHTTSLWWYRLCLNYQAFRILHKKTTVTLYSRISISVVEILFFFHSLKISTWRICALHCRFHCMPCHYNHFMSLPCHYNHFMPLPITSLHTHIYLTSILSILPIWGQ